MTAIAMRILVIGEPSPGTSAILRRLATRSWGSRCVETLKEARDLLGTFHFDVVLAKESLADGRGYDAAEAVLRHSGTLLVGVALSESWLWLPVIEQGARVLGTRALNADMLESELEIFLADRARQNLREVVRKPILAIERHGPHRAGIERRKHVYGVPA